MLLDLFFSAAVPFMVICVVVAKLGAAFCERRGVYKTPEGEARRDAINERYRTNLGSLVIAVVFVLLWVLTVYELVQRWGAIFFTFAIGAVIVIPYMAVCAGVIMMYTLAVHGAAKAKSR